MRREAAGSTMAITMPMAEYLAQAYNDMPEVKPSVLYERFMGWAR